MPSFDFSLLISGHYHDVLVAGLQLSLKLLGVTLLLAVPLAVLVALMRLSGVWVWRSLAWCFVEFIRNAFVGPHAFLVFWCARAVA